MNESDSSLKTLLSCGGSHGDERRGRSWEWPSFKVHGRWRIKSICIFLDSFITRESVTRENYSKKPAGHKKKSDLDYNKIKIYRVIITNCFTVA